MFGYLLLALLAIPLVEVILLIKIGQVLGSGITILLIFITGILGAFLAKYQGLKVLWELHYLLERRMMPGNKLVEGLFVLVGGIFLLFPGFITDIVGFLFLLPLTRQFFAVLVLKWIAEYFRSGRIRIFM